jgi:hypothetical protein
MDKFILNLAAAIILIFSCSTPKAKPPLKIISEHKTVNIPLAGEAASGYAELSGLCNLEKNIALLPQYPNKFDNSIFSIPQKRINRFLDQNDLLPIVPHTIKLQNLNELINRVEGYEGFEAIANAGNGILFFSIEAKKNNEMGSYIVKAFLNEDKKQIQFDLSNLIYHSGQSGLWNYSEEAIFVYGENIFGIHEINSPNFNKYPMATKTSKGMQTLEAISFPHIRFRVTDATDVDRSGYFWVLNYHWQDERKIQNNYDDTLMAIYGLGATHRKTLTVERLVELQVTPEKIQLTGRAPIYLNLNLNADSRNWEGITRFNNGFLICTDKFPQTLLHYVEVPL